jgi:hypothetical protein
MRRGVVGLLVVASASCASVQQTDSTLPPLEGAPGLTTPTPTIAQVDVTAPIDDTIPVVNPTRVIAAADVPAQAECVLSALPAQGQLTFAFADRIYALNPDATLTCLADLSLTPDLLLWSPDGDEVLLGPQRLLRGDGSVVDTRFLDTNTGVSWSQPTGKALIAPNPATGQLFWRNAQNLDERLDITFTNGTIAAAYHPSGTRIAAIGTGINDGKPGVFLATNRGEEAQRIDEAEDGVRPTELGFDMSGSSLVFVRKQPGGGGRVSRYLLGSGDLLTIAERPDAVPAALIVSAVDEGDVAWAETGTDGLSLVYAAVGLEASEATLVATPAGTSARPVGWLPGNRLVVAVRAGGSATGPFDVWIWTPAGALPLVTGTDAAGVRAPHGPWSNPPGADVGSDTSG